MNLGDAGVSLLVWCLMTNHNHLVAPFSATRFRTMHGKKHLVKEVQFGSAG